MTNAPPPEPALQTTFGPVVATGMASSAAGDQIGTALADIINWTLQSACNCQPPAQVLSDVHTLCVLIVVGIAYSVHYTLLKNKD